MRDSLLRFGALWAVLSGTSPLPMLLTSAHAAPGPMCSQDGADGTGGFDVSAPAIHAASVGTLDELVELWPSLVHAEKLLMFIDYSVPIADGFAAEVWSVDRGEAAIVGLATYVPWYVGQTIGLDVPDDALDGERGTDGTGGLAGGLGNDDPPREGRRTDGDSGVGAVLQMNLTIGLLTAIDGPFAGTEIGIEGLAIDLDAALLAAASAYHTYWGPGDLPPSGPAPILPFRSMPAEQAIEEAIEQDQLDELMGPDGDVITCIDPGWIGSDGIQCCSLYLSPDAAAIHCRTQFLAAFWACMTVGGAFSSVFVYELAKRCLAGLPALWKPCLALAIGVGVVVLACYAQAKWVMTGCVASKLHENNVLLAEHGCLPIPRGTQP